MDTIPADRTAEDLLTDAQVFSASVARPEMLAIVFDRHAPELLRYLTRRIGPTDAEDLLGDVFVVALERRASFDPAAGSAKPWLYGIASNLLHRRRRSEARLLAALARHGRDPGLTVLDDRTDSRAESRIDSARALAGLASALKALSPGDRNVLLLLAWAQLSQQEIATALEIPVGTVKSRLNRARRILRAHLDTDHSEGDLS